MKKIILFIFTISAILTASCGRTFPSLPNEGSLDAAPIVISATAIALNKVRVSFSEVMDPVYTLSMANFAISNDSLGLVSAAADPTNGATVVLTTSNMSAASNYILVVQGARDMTGNTNIVAAVNFNGYGASDTTPPGLSITEPLPDQLIGKSFLVYGTASDNSGIARVEIRVDSGSYQQASNTVNWSYLLDTSIYSEAYDHLVYVKATDLKGNSTVQVVTVSIDRTAPTLSVTSAPSGVKVINPGQTITLTGTASDNVQFSTVGAYLTNYHGAFKYGGTWTSGTDWQIVISDTGMLDESTNKLYIVAQDLAGNTRTSNVQYILYRNIIYIKTNGSATGDGTYWGPRNNFIVAGLISGSYYNEVWVADGLYDGNGTIASANYANSVIRGGYSQDFMTRNITGYKTEFSGSLTFPNPSVTLEGFKTKAVYTGDHTITLVSNYIVGSYNYSLTSWPNGSKQVFYGNTFTNSSITFFNTFQKTSTYASGIYMTNNKIYGHIDSSTGASMQLNPYRLNSFYISNTFIGVGSLTNYGLKLTPLNLMFNGTPSAINYTMVRGNTFSNYYIGVWLNDSSGLTNQIFIRNNVFYTKLYAFKEENAASDPDKFFSNHIVPLSGYYYYDFDRTPKEVGTISDLNALDEGGFNPAGSTYSNW